MKPHWREWHEIDPELDERDARCNSCQRHECEEKDERGDLACCGLWCGSVDIDDADEAYDICLIGPGPEEQ